jgi:peptide/nickel transport system substrate-binding protein
MRELIRMPQFRKALSMAFNRAQVQKDFYFNRGEQTSGTYSPKAIEYNVNDEGKQLYAEYRDFAAKYDPEAAKALLDEIGVKEGSGGKRTMPDGSPLVITLDYTSDQGREIVSKNERLAADWVAIGIDARLNPIPPQGAKEAWIAGDKLSNAQWGVGDGPNHLVYPQWLVPIEEERWAPLTGTFYKLRGTEQVSAELEEIAQPDVDPYERNPPRQPPEEGDPIDRLWEIYDKSRVEPDPMARHQLVWEMCRIHIEDGPFFQGSVSNAPYPFLVKNGLMNVPQQEDLALGGFCAPWIHPTPAVYDPETWFWDDPDAHA